MHHILIGYDHILFLISLVLPAVLRRHRNGWNPIARWQQAVWPMVTIVTMFTIGHSITLALAGLKLVDAVAASHRAGNRPSPSSWRRWTT